MKIGKYTINLAQAATAANALLALVLSISLLVYLTGAADEARIDRYYRQLSLMPSIHFSYETDETKPDVGLAIINAGPGNAYIKDIKMFFDRKPVASWDNAAEACRLTDGSEAHEADMDKDEPLGAGTISFLLSRSAKNKSGLHEFVRCVSEHIAVSVKYCAADNKCYKKCSSKGHCE